MPLRPLRQVDAAIIASTLYPILVELEKRGMNVAAAKLKSILFFSADTCERVRESTAWAVLHDQQGMAAMCWDARDTYVSVFAYREEDVRRLLDEAQVKERWEAAGDSGHLQTCAEGNTFRWLMGSCESTIAEWTRNALDELGIARVTDDGGNQMWTRASNSISTSNGEPDVAVDVDRVLLEELGLDITQLCVADAEVVNAQWTYASSHSLATITDCIIHRPTAALRRRGGGDLVGWVTVRADGSFGMLYVSPALRRKGLGQLLIRRITASISKQPALVWKQSHLAHDGQQQHTLHTSCDMGDDGDHTWDVSATVFCFIVPGNEASMRMHRALGFEFNNTCAAWIRL